MVGRAVRSLVLVCVVCFSVSCANSNEVNAAFNRTRVTWALFDPKQPDGLRPLPGLQQASPSVWVPRPQGVFATDRLALAGGSGVVAVSRLGLVALEDSAGALTSFKPASQWPLEAYRTDRLFLWKERVFITLRQEPPFEAIPASLAWWEPGQERLAFYPIPSQIRNPRRQVQVFFPPNPGSSELGLLWKQPTDNGWTFETADLALDTGTETVVARPFAEQRFKPSATDLALKSRLVERLGEVVALRALGSGTPLMFTESGWVAVGTDDSGHARLYHLPDLGASGRYTGALTLSHGYVFTWETAFRGYSGPSGVVYFPFAVLAP